MSKASVYYTVENINNPHDIKRIKNELNMIAGVLSVGVNNDKNSVSVDFDTTGTGGEKIKKKLCELGYEITAEKTENHIM